MGRLTMTGWRSIGQHSSRAGGPLSTDPRRWSRWAWAILALLLATGPAQAEIRGPARAVDGDSLEIRGQLIRLYGVDAPEPGQRCERDGREYDCWLQASFGLSAITANHWLRCVERGRDPAGTLIAVCYAGPYDVNATIVRDGWALAARAETTDYVPFESQARAARRGLWAGRFTAPWDWRLGLRTPYAE